MQRLPEMSIVTNPPFCEWAIIGQTSQTLIVTAATSRDVKSYESAILRVGDNRANLPNANSDYAPTSRDVKSYESAILRVGDNRVNIPNANSDYAETSRGVTSYESTIL